MASESRSVCSSRNALDANFSAEALREALDRYGAPGLVRLLQHRTGSWRQVIGCRRPVQGLGSTAYIGPGAVGLGFIQD